MSEVSGNVLIPVVLTVVGVVILVIIWNAVQERRANRLPPPLVFAFDDSRRPLLTPSAPPAAAPAAQLAPSSPSSPRVGVAPRLGGAAAAALAPTHQAVAHPPSTSITGPTQLRVVRDTPQELATYQGELASNETVRFRRPSDEPVQLLPGRLEVLAGEPRHREIRFVRVPGRPAELILGREPGDTPQHVALSSTTVSRRHARFAFLDGRWSVMNLSRTNPIVINGEELLSNDAIYELHEGDRLELGEVILRFTLGNPSR